MIRTLLPSTTRQKLTGTLLKIVTALALVAGIGACNGDDDTPGGDGSPGTTTPSDRATRTSTADSNGGGQTLNELLETYLSGVDGKITYRTTSENFGEHPNLIWTEYRLGEDTRIDWRNVVENPADDPMISTTAILSGAGSYICTTSPGLKSCNTKSSEEAQTLVFWRPAVDEPLEAIADGAEDLTVSEASEREIAGTQASCFDVESPTRLGVGQPGKESLELCFSAEGGLLVMSRTITFGDTAFPTARLGVTAQEVGAADPSDFEPIASPLN
jgi:hypothetical protein